MDLKKSLSSVYLNNIGKNIDSKELWYWESKIHNKASSYDDFLSFVYTHPDYKTQSSKRFQRFIINYIPDLSSSTEDEYFNTFWEMRSSEITDESIIKFITSLPDFEKMFTAVVKDVVEYETDHNANRPYIIEAVVKKALGSKKLYTNSMMLEDIHNLAKVNDSTDMNTTVNEDDFKKIKGMLKYIDDFEDVFNRPIFVQEFFKYIVENNGNEINWAEIYNDHIFNFNTMKKMFQNYTGKTISEYYYVKKYLYDADDDEFFPNFINTIVHTPEYKSGMTKTIKEKYNSLFDQDLSESDVDYIFNIFQNKKLDIMTEEIDKLLVEFKELTDQYVSQIFQVYDKTLSRAPELDEIEKYNEYYRKVENTDEANKSLEKMLINTLEFHDIIKERIKKMYKEKYNSDISYSLLYSTLNRIIVKIDDITMENLDDVISKN